MLDGFSRKIEYLRISLTDRCNLRCKYCMPAEGVPKNSHWDILTLEEILRVVRLISKLGIKKIRLTGGEPLIRRNLLLLIKEIRKIPAIENIAITTNGVLLADMAQDLYEAGIDQLNISLDTMRKETFADLCRVDALGKVLQGIDTAIKIGFSDIKINCVPIKGVNDEDIAELAGLAQNRPIKVRYIELMPVGCAFDSGLKGLPTSEVRSLIEKKWGTLHELPPAKGKILGPASYCKLDGFSGEIGFIDALEHKFCDKCNRVRLTSEGFLKLCLNHKEGTDLRTPLRKGKSDEELLELLTAAINQKPQEHLFLEKNDHRDKRNMYQVGG